MPVRVAGAASWRSLDAGFQHTCGVTSDDQGWCWGWNDQGQLGNGTHETTYFPVPGPSRLPGSWTDLAAALHGSSGTRAAGSAWAWGEGAYGALGGGVADQSDDPVEVDVLP